MNGWRVDWGDGVFAEKFKLVVCGFEFGLEGEVVDVEEGEEEKGNRRRWLE